MFPFRVKRYGFNHLKHTVLFILWMTDHDERCTWDKNQQCWNGELLEYIIYIRGVEENGSTWRIVMSKDSDLIHKLLGVDESKELKNQTTTNGLISTV